MKASHKGMNINESDWSIFLEHAGASLNALNVPKEEVDDVVALVLSIKQDIVES